MHKGSPGDIVHRGPSGEIVETAREARQGYRDRPVLYVVSIGTGLALVALLALWWFAT
jgi:hypothetical protein